MEAFNYQTGHVKGKFRIRKYVAEAETALRKIAEYNSPADLKIINLYFEKYPQKRKR